MTNQNITLFLEFPSDVNRQEVQDLEKALKNIQGIETEIQTTRDPLAIITLVVEIAASVGIVAASIKSAYEVGEIFYKFLHREDNNKVEDQRKKKIILKQGNKSVEIYNYSLEEIKQLLSPKE